MKKKKASLYGILSFILMLIFAFPVSAEETITVNLNESKTVYVSNPNGLSVVWMSSDNNIAECKNSTDYSCDIVGLNTGTATITAKDVYTNAVLATYVVTVTEYHKVGCKNSPMEVSITTGTLQSFYFQLEDGTILDAVQKSMSGFSSGYFSRYIYTYEVTIPEAGDYAIHIIGSAGTQMNCRVKITEHSWGEYVPYITPTCTGEGCDVRYCILCRQDDYKNLDALGHDFSEEWTVDKEPDCIHEGEKSRHCSRCSERTEVTAIPVAEHTPGEYEVAKEAACTEPGVKEQKCRVCGEVLDTKEIKATGHKPGEYEVAKEAACTEPGVKEQKCRVCGEVLDTKEIEATGHTPGEYKVTKEASCTELGVKEQKCSVCGEVLDTKEIEATGHKPGEYEVAKEATCTEPGVKEQKCSVCGEVLDTKEIEATGHIPGEYEVAKEATCTEPGVKEQKCGVCGEVLDTEEIEATGHKLGDWFVVKQATDKAQGMEKRKCMFCDYSETREIPMVKSPDSTVVKKLKLNASGTIPLQVGTSCSEIEATQISSGDKIIRWKSSNKKIAVISRNGKLTGKKKGKATITAYTKMGQSASFRVVVQKKPVALKKLSVGKRSITLAKKKGKNIFYIKAQKSPITYMGKVTYQSANKKIAKVNAKGIVTAKKAGKTKIYVKCGKKKIAINVTVKNR